jgi:glucose-1-phosphate adenylyltransferase
MNDCTIISYPGSGSASLLSLTEARSQYMLPFAGRFRVVDFTLRNSFSSGARNTILYNNVDDDLEDYVSLYGPFEDPKFPPVKVVSRKYSDIGIFYNLILDSNTHYYILYNGDNPSIIDFGRVMERFKEKKARAMLFRLPVEGKHSMAYKALVADQKTLLKVINQAMKERRESPNIFEMIINVLINRGIDKSSIHGHYWPLRSVTDYYMLNREIIQNAEIFGLLYHEKIIQSKILADGYAVIGREAKVTRSFISDFCSINGTVDNSIIFPGVFIGRGSTVIDSILLPYVRIGEGSRIEHAIIDERIKREPGDESFDIGTSCRIGSSEEHIKNKDYSRSLFESVTLIGKDCRIAEGARIGGGCYVASGLGEEFMRKKFLYDGESLVAPRAPGGAPPEA